MSARQQVEDRLLGQSRMTRRAKASAIVAVCAIVAALSLWVIDSTSAAYRDQAHTVGDPVGIEAGVMEYTMVAAGEQHSVVIGADGVTYSWGVGAYGRLGNGDALNVTKAKAVSLPPGVRSVFVAAGFEHSASIDEDGNAWSWGAARHGDGAEKSIQSLPIRVTMPDGVKFSAIALSGGDHSLALGEDGNAYSWGGSALGTAEEGPLLVPVPVVMPAGVRFTDIQTGTGFSLALGDDGQAYGWGSAALSGSGNPEQFPSPVVVDTCPKVVGIATGPNSAFMLCDDGSVHAWGAGGDGKLGIATAWTNVATPLPVVVPAGVRFTQMSGAAKSTVALGDNGIAYTAGSGEENALGTGGPSTNVTRFAPVSMPPGVTFTAVSAGRSHAIASAVGRQYEWGVYPLGIIGIDVGNLSAQTPTPVWAPPNGDLSFVADPVGIPAARMAVS
jgi:alpha-tubulin suppressor-like RCC1 family protein